MALKRKPLDQNPDFQRALALHQGNQWDQAEALYQQLLQRYPRHPQLLANLGALALQTGRLEQSITLLEQSLAAQPNQSVANSNLAIALQYQGQSARALSHYDRAISLAPHNADAYANKAMLLLDLGRPEEAVESSDHALSLQPRHIGAWNNKGTALEALGRQAEARDCYEQVILLNPGHLLARNNKANTLLAEARYETAHQTLQEVLLLDPTFVDAHVNVGNCFLGMRRLEEAKVAFQTALELDPGHVTARTNLGMALGQMGSLAPAIELWNEALSRQPNYAPAIWCLATARLVRGEYAEGWPLFESRWLDPQKAARRHFTQPLWLGEPESSLSGKTLLLHAEQGLGDTLQFCRYVPMVGRVGGRIILEVQPLLQEFLQQQFSQLEVLAYGDPLPDFDLHCPLMSLPLAFRTELDSIPADIPYLSARPERIAAWGERLGPRQRPRIGLVWSGNPAHKNDHNRSLRLSQLETLLESPYDWHILQKDIQPEDEATLKRLPQLQDHRHDLTDFDATAGLLSHMDLLISVDTSVAHLAGSLGKPVWLLLPYMPDYRWLLDRPDSPWYPSFTLYRQPAIGDWASVLQQVQQQLPTL